MKYLFEIVNYFNYSKQVKKQFYHMSGVRVLTVLDSAKHAVSVDRVWRSFVSQGAC